MRVHRRHFLAAYLLLAAVALAAAAAAVWMLAPDKVELTRAGPPISNRSSLPELARHFDQAPAATEQPAPNTRCAGWQNETSPIATWVVTVCVIDKTAPPGGSAESDSTR